MEQIHISWDMKLCVSALGVRATYYSPTKRDKMIMSWLSILYKRQKFSLANRVSIFVF